MKLNIIQCLVMVSFFFVGQSSFAHESNGADEVEKASSAMSSVGSESKSEPVEGESARARGFEGGHSEGGFHPGWGGHSEGGFHPGWGGHSEGGFHPGWGGHSEGGFHPGWGGHAGYGPHPGWHTDPFSVRWGFAPWRRWEHPYFVRPVFAFEWDRVAALTCSALDSSGRAYPITVNEWRGRAYEERIGQIEDLALDRCYEESGGDPSCYLEGCWPGY